MTELLDAMDDAGIDPETAAFLIEALGNAEPDQWPDIVEPFVKEPAAVLKVLSSMPAVIARSSAIVESQENATRAAREAAEAAEAKARAWMEVLSGVLEMVNVRCVSRMARVCRETRKLVSADSVWDWRTRRSCTLWGIQWIGCGRDAFFNTLRPRYDGMYVGECGYTHYFRMGCSTDLRKNAEQVKSNQTSFWVDYRRYMRLLPPDPKTNIAHAMVLQDTCSVDTAESLFSELDVNTHVNRFMPSQFRAPANKARSRSSLEAKVFVGTYRFLKEIGHIEITYTSSDGLKFDVLLGLSHGGWSKYSGQLEWMLYNQTENGEVLEFCLGRRPDRSGLPVDHSKDHFATMSFKVCRAFQHLQ